MREHDAEPVTGLPERLPAGEHLIWQGAPEWRALARHSFHHRSLAWYLAAASTWSVVCAFPLTQDSALEALRNIGLSGIALGLIALFAWLTARSTVYTLTNKRLVIQFGITLPMTINLPFKLVESADVKLNADGTGDLSVQLAKSQKLAYLVVWPHVRPWRLSAAQPSLRSIPDAGRVAQLLGRALAASADQPAPVRVPVSALAPDSRAAAAA